MLYMYGQTGSMSAKIHIMLGSQLKNFVTMIGHVGEVFSNLGVPTIIFTHSN